MSLSSLRLLLVEDSEADAALLLRELRRGGYAVTFERVESAGGMRAALSRGSWDIIISDCGMPSFNALTAVRMVREAGSDIPFIVLSGTLDEEDAVEVLRAGANDFLTKAKMARLLPAVERELREKVGRDEGRRSQSRIKVTEERFRTLLESAPDGMVIVGSDGRIAFVNARTEALFGYPREELVGEPIEVLVPVRLRAKLREQRSSFFESDEPLPSGAGLELLGLRKNGTEFPVEIRLSPARTAEGDVVTAAIRDVTERKQAEEALKHTEEQLRQAQKMEAVGALAGGVAHDFNNVLSVILSYTGFLTDTTTPDDPRRTDIDEIRKASLRAVQLTRQLLMFSRKQPIVPRVVNLNEIVAGLEKMLRRLAGDTVEVVFVPGHALGMVRADPGQIEQVIMNLVVNARDAMPKGGRITIETMNVEYGEGKGPHPGMADGAYVVIGVADTGMGMDATTRERIFEPFFTTKETGKGTGLGLSVVYGIVSQAGGQVAVESQPGEGATFCVFLPQTEGKVDDSNLPPPSATLGGSETVLVVEDDDQVRVVVAMILRRNGYSVLEARNAGEALLVCEQTSAAIALLLTDVNMPRMGGYELAARLAPARPRMKTLYMSGHAEAASLERDATHLLEKPITADALLSRVREVLDRDALESTPTA